MLNYPGVPNLIMSSCTWSFLAVVRDGSEGGRVREALKMEPGGHQPKNVGTLYQLEEARMWTFTWSLQK